MKIEQKKKLEKARELAIFNLEDEDGDYFESEVEIFVMGYMAATKEQDRASKILDHVQEFHSQIGKIL